MDDLPLVVQDRMFDASGQFVYHGHGADAECRPPAGMLGDDDPGERHAGALRRRAAKLIRLRLVNGSNGRRYNFGFADNRAFKQIAVETAACWQRRWRAPGCCSAPGETAREILVDLHAATGPLTLMSYRSRGQQERLPGAGREGVFGDDDQHQQFKILELRPQAGTFAGPGPSRKRSPPSSGWTQPRHPRPAVYLASTINNKSMDHARVDEVVKKGDIEIWEVHNESPFLPPVPCS